MALRDCEWDGVGQMDIGYDRTGQVGTGHGLVQYALYDFSGRGRGLNEALSRAGKAVLPKAMNNEELR